MGAHVGHVPGSMGAVGAAETGQLAALELGVIVEIVLVAEDAGAGRTREPLLLAGRAHHASFLIAPAPLRDGRGTRELWQEGGIV